MWDFFRKKINSINQDVTESKLPPKKNAAI